ncbi:hypothetical protein [Timonella sp. A28]|uniref:hypothetical protein n=1 Tax=Timonella sp. A28 TaxID=3442640 RepID=UPI003EB69FE8
MNRAALRASSYAFIGTLALITTGCATDESSAQPTETSPTPLASAFSGQKFETEIGLTQPDSLTTHTLSEHPINAAKPVSLLAWHDHQTVISHGLIEDGSLKENNKLVFDTKEGAYHLTPPAVQDDPPRQALTASITEKYVVWSEAAGLESGTAQRVFLHDKAKKTTNFIHPADTTKFGLTLGAIGGDALPVFSDDKIWWHTTYQTPEGNKNPALVMHDPLHGATTVVAEGYTQPKPLGDGIVALGLNPHSSGTTTTGTTTHDPNVIASFSYFSSDGKSTDLITFNTAHNESEFVHDFDAHDKLLAVGYKNSILVFDEHGTPLTRINTENFGVPSSIRVCGNNVVFTTGNDTSAATVHATNIADNTVQSAARNTVVTSITCNADAARWTENANGTAFNIEARF